MLKFFARLGGMRVAFIIHTNQSYLDYRSRRDIAHDEYEVRRLFDSGVTDFLFTPDIYDLDMADPPEPADEVSQDDRAGGVSLNQTGG